MSDSDKTFHLAITMAGAISAGAYTAGVMDYLLEALDNWADMKKEAAQFFVDYPQLKGANWQDFEKTPEYKELLTSEENLEDLQKKALRYNSVPDHNIQIEIISGASAGGMTAAIASLVLQLENKHHVKFLPDVKETETLKELREIRKNNRLYNSWVNLTSNDMLSALLGDSDIEIAGMPLAVLNSQFIREVAQRALKVDETDVISRAPYVADDFNLFMTLTNLEGYQKSLNIDSSGHRADNSSYGDFITYNHSDLVMFSFGENRDAGTVHINFNNKTDPINEENIKLLGDAAVATGAFPIGLEYASFSRKPEVINNNFLINQIHSDQKELVAQDKIYRTTFIDGGLINNEPFELTDCLLKEKLKQKLKNSSNQDLKNEKDKFIAEFSAKFKKENKRAINNEELREELERWFERKVREQKNYTILMIDPFPSEKKPPKEEKASPNQNYYPFSLLGVLGQLIGTMRSQLLVKTNLFASSRDINDFSCYLIAPRRRVFEKTKDGKLKIDKKTNRPIPVYERYDTGTIVTDANDKPISKAYDGSAAIACGCLGGFGGFLDKEFRAHDFYLGRLNCQSFIRQHFRMKSDGDERIENNVTKAYSETAKKIFQKECRKEFVPVIPDMDLLKAETLLSTEEEKPTPADLYCKLSFPKYDMKNFHEKKSEILNRIWMIIDSLLKSNKQPFYVRYYIKLGFIASKNSLFEKVVEIVTKQLTDWELTKVKSEKVD